MNSLLHTAKPTQTANTKIAGGDFLRVVAGIAALLGFIYFFQVEKQLELFSLSAVVAAGVVAHRIAPLRFKLPVLSAVFWVGAAVLFSPLDAMILLGLGGILFAVINLPLGTWPKTTLLLLIGALLAVCRLGWMPALKNDAVLAVVGSLFMFRSILYVHEERFLKEKPSFWLRLNYFFLLPNLIFLIFPVVDFKTFINNYYTKPAYDTYRKGLLWMMNGVLHFLFYRLIYFYLVPNPVGIENVFDWFQFLVASYALIVRLAGIFHFSAGVICLFGFDLPPPFRHYFFADSFSDLWRRINIYWRDFVMKVFYYPIYFKVKRLGITRAIVISVLLTFAVNWFLHAYQWLWIQGSLLFTLQDISFWAIFGIAVAGNSLYLAKYRKRKINTKVWAWSRASQHVLRVMGVFLFMALLWSWWTAPSPQHWQSFMGVWSTVDRMDLLLLSVVFSGVFAGGLLLYYWDWKTKQRSDHWRYDTARQWQWATLLLVVFTIAGWSPVTRKIEQTFSIDLAPIVSTQLNAMDQDAQFQGYYETMLDQTQVIDSPLDQLRKQKPEDWPHLMETGAIVRHRSALAKTLVPNLKITFKDQLFTTNAWGLRDYPTDTLPPPGTLRMALMGGSIEMGSGVPLEHTYENILTEYLNNDERFQSYDSIEILNFGVSGTHLPQHLTRLEQMVADFHPDVVFYAAHSDEIARITNSLYPIYNDSLLFEHAHWDNLLTELDLGEHTDRRTFRQKLKPHILEFIRWGYRTFQAEAERQGAIAVWLFIPTLDDRQTPRQDLEIIRIIQQELGLPLLDVRSAFQDIEKAAMIVAPWDRHPNAEGHRLLAEQLYRELLADEALMDLLTDKE